MKAGDISFWDFQIENHISNLEHRIDLLKRNSPDSVVTLIAEYLEKDLTHFKATVENRKQKGELQDA